MPPVSALTYSSCARSRSGAAARRINAIIPGAIHRRRNMSDYPFRGSWPLRDKRRELENVLLRIRNKVHPIAMQESSIKGWRYGDVYESGENAAFTNIQQRKWAGALSQKVGQLDSSGRDRFPV